jgi:hypothetical protein
VGGSARGRPGAGGDGALGAPSTQEACREGGLGPSRPHRRQALRDEGRDVPVHDAAGQGRPRLEGGAGSEVDGGFEVEAVDVSEGRDEEVCAFLEAVQARKGVLSG